MPEPPSYAYRVRAKVRSETTRFTQHKLLTGACVAYYGSYRAPRSVAFSSDYNDLGRGLDHSADHCLLVCNRSFGIARR
jgi:hypothetical protein